MKYKRLSVFVLVILLFAFIGGIYLVVSYHNKVNFSKQFVEDIGGESLLKKECMKENSGPHHMDNGKTYERLLSVNDIRRIPKLCDCMVEKTYKMIMNMKPMLEQKNVAEVPDDVKQTLRRMFYVNYDFCEDEMIRWLEKRYKPVEMD